MGRAAALSFLGFICCLGCGGKGSNPTRGGSVSPATTTDWTHAELLDHLRKAGLKFRDRPDGGLSKWLVFVDTAEEEQRVFHLKEAVLPNSHVEAESKLVLVRKVDDARRGKDEEGVDPPRRYLWGKFLFVAGGGAEPHLDAIRKALPK